jgi:ribonuclease Y
LIGREGRNIRTFEQLTGATLLIDETPDAVLVSCFDPVRRETARLALCAVVADGRVSPTLIEACVTQARTEVETSLKKFGREAVRDLGLPPMEAAVEELLGRLHFRLSANQNTLAHSVEVARLCAIMATELGLDPVPAKRAGLLHDLGKALEDENERCLFYLLDNKGRSRGYGRQSVEVQHTGEVHHAHRVTVEPAVVGSALDLLRELGAIPAAPAPAAVDPAQPLPQAARRDDGPPR